MINSIEEKVNKFKEDIEFIVKPSKIIGFDFIAVGNDYFYVDYLLHEESEKYLEFLEKEYFNNNPSLLLLDGLFEKFKHFNSKKKRNLLNLNLKYLEKQIEKSNFTFKSKLSKTPEQYWEFWCETIKKYYSNCESIYFIKEDFDKLVQTTAIFIYFNKNIENVTDCKQGLMTKISKALLYEEAVNVFLPKHIKQIQLQSIKSAISQVMLRNMSHNIGSHVLSKMLDVTAIESFIEKSPSKIIEQYTGLESNNIFAKEPKNLIAVFNSYMRSRMDFLADATTGVPTIESSKWLFKEIISGIDKNRLLLNRISGINDFYFKFKVNNSVNKENDKNECDYSVREISDGNKGDKEKFKIENDILVSIPNDVLGFHAIYVIIENIIRNSAKHSADCDKGKKKDNPIIINIDIKETTELEGTNANELYEINIYEDCIIKNEEKVPIDKDDKEKYSKYFKPEKNGDIKIGNLDKLVFDMNYRLNQSVLDNGVLRQGSWGLIEMDASAAYLRKIPIEKIDEDHFEIDLKKGDSFLPENKYEEKNLNILKAIKIGEKHFGYRFFVYKPREVLMICDNNSLSNIDKDARKKLLKEGILVCDYSNKEIDSFTFDKSKIYNHKLVVVISNNPDVIINSNRTGISERILIIGLEESKNHPALILITGDLDNFKKEIWKCYLRNTKYEFFADYNGLLNFISAGVPKVENSDIAYFLNHGKGYDRYKSKFKEIRYSAVENFMPVNKDVVTTIQFLDSIHTKVVIVDERIQAYSKLGKYPCNDGNEINVECIYKNTNIVVPDESAADLNKSNFDDQYDKILKIFEVNNDAFFYVIHLGIIEKLIASNNRKKGATKFNKDTQIKIFIEEFICKNKIEYNKIIIISGRGTPHNLPEDTRYLNYSIISQYMIDMRFKYLLSEALFSSRKIK